MRQPLKRDPALEEKPLLPSFLTQGDVVDDEDCPPTDGTKVREGIARLKALLATIPPDDPFEEK